MGAFEHRKFAWSNWNRAQPFEREEVGKKSMSTGKEQLEKMVGEIRKGLVPQPVTVREFLSWFGAERRGYVIVWNIRRVLKEVGLETKPDFEYAYIDGLVSFVAAGSVGTQSPTTGDVLEGPVADPTYRIGRLDSANKKPTSVPPDAALALAITLMLKNDFSQLPVMTTEREVKGVVSWKSIGSHLAIGSDCESVRQCMEPPHIVDIDASIFAAIGIIADNDYVLVRNSERTITGIVTASDLAHQFRQLAEPFMLIGEIENHVRRLIYGKFTVNELRESQDTSASARNVDGVTDLTFGEYVRLLESEPRWHKLDLKVDRRVFVASLDRIREIRNDVMHFAPDKLLEEDMDILRDFSKFLRTLAEIAGP